jgi:hypothetical protein
LRKSTVFAKFLFIKNSFLTQNEEFKPNNEFKFTIQIKIIQKLLDKIKEFVTFALPNWCGSSAG